MERMMWHSCRAVWFGTRKLLVILWLATLVVPAWAQWTNVGVGIDYQYFRVGNTNDIFVTRMSRTNKAATIDTSIGQGKQPGYLETVRNQASRYDDALTWWGGQWGARNDVVVAINGGFYDTSTYIISGGQIQSGWYTHFFADAFSGFAWRTNRTAFIGECVNNFPTSVYVRFPANNQTQPLNGINQAPGSNDLILFTPQYNSQTPSGTRTEVLVELTKPNLTTAGAGYNSGIIRSVVPDTGATWIPFDHVVLSADGAAGNALYNNATVGAEVRIHQELYDENEPDVQGNNGCTTPTGINWANVFASINSNFHFLKNNVVRVPDAVAHPGYAGYVNLNPRTAICYNADYVFFVIVDGRSARSKGINCADLGYWARAALGATEGVNLDGGGSSTMVVNGVVRNVPSDGSQRSVCNGVMMVNVVPKAVSTTLIAGQNVKTSASASLRLGPGSNYATRATIAQDAQGSVISHQLNGVYAKGSYWWKCNFNGTIGWMAQSSLIALPMPPFITLQPSDRGVVADGNTSFTVGAAGTSPLGYRWQRNQVNLANGGEYSGCTTPTLAITGATSNNVANYRCVITNAYGTTNSLSAALAIIPPVPCPGLRNADFESGFSLGGGGYLAEDWSEWETDPDVVIGYDEDVIVRSGGHAQRLRIWGGASGSSGGVYQRIPIAAGQPFTVSVWANSGDGETACSLGVDPAGGTNGTIGVSWSPATTNTAWTQHTMMGNATASYLTVYYRVATTDDNKRNGYFDDGAPAEANGPLQLGAQRSGSNLTLTWPECPAAVLQRSDTLTSPNWIAVTNPVTAAGGQNSVMLAPTGSTGYFRLVRD